MAATIRITALSLEVPGQVARPVADVSAGGWTPSTGSDLYATLDEIAASDADYSSSSSSGADACVVAGTCRLRVRVKRG